MWAVICTACPQSTYPARAIQQQKEQPNIAAEVNLHRELSMVSIMIPNAHVVYPIATATVIGMQELDVIVLSPLWRDDPVVVINARAFGDGFHEGVVSLLVVDYFLKSCGND
jgi:hypothetical protein